MVLSVDGAFSRMALLPQFSMQLAAVGHQYLSLSMRMSVCLRRPMLLLPCVRRWSMSKVVMRAPYSHISSPSCLSFSVLVPLMKRRMYACSGSSGLRDLFHSFATASMPCLSQK